MRLPVEFLLLILMRGNENNRQCLTQRIYPTLADSMSVSLFSTEGKATFASVRAWDMAAIEVLAESCFQE